MHSYINTDREKYKIMLFFLGLFRKFDQPALLTFAALCLNGYIIHHYNIWALKLFIVHFIINSPLCDMGELALFEDWA